MSKVHEAVCAMLADVEEIKKTRDNKQQGYKFRGIDDVYNAVHPLLAKHKVFPACEILDKTTSERETKAGGTLFCVQIKSKYTFYADDGSSISTEAIGEGMDSADKASNKAMSSAYKYALFQLLCIPTEAVDSENDNYEVAPQRKAQEIAKQHGMTTGDQIKPPANFDSMLGKVPTLDSLDRLKKALAWVEGELVAKHVTAAQAETFCLALAERAIELCNELPDYEQADALIRDMGGKMRIHDAKSMELRVKLSDAKDAKLGAAA